MRADGKQEPDEGCDPLSANLKGHFVSLHVLSSMPRMVQMKKRILNFRHKELKASLLEQNQYSAMGLVKVLQRQCCYYRYNNGYLVYLYCVFTIPQHF